MKIVKAFPPNFSAIAKVFPVKGKPGILYAYGKRLYNPSMIPVTPWIAAHEQVHMDRQIKDPGVVKWWEHYLTDMDFRLEEEALAHRAEFLEFDKWHTPQDSEHYLGTIAKRLASPLYGSMLSEMKAVQLITGAKS